MKDWWKDFWDESYLHELVSRQGRTRKEIDFVEDVLKPKRSGLLLDLGCGIGRHSIELARRGYRVLGADYSKTYLDYAGKKAGRTPNLSFMRLDMRKLSFRNRFDTVINLYTSFGYFSDDENADVIRRVHSALRKGGKFIIDVTNRDAVLQNFRRTLTTKTPYGKTVHKSEFDYSTSRMISDWVFYRHGRAFKKGTTSLRMYSYHELRKMLEDSGFRVLKGYGGFGKEKVGPDDYRLILVCRKTGR